jgi:hypothetical protein
MINGNGVTSGSQARSMKKVVFRDAASCSLADTDQHFRAHHDGGGKDL